MLCTATAIKRSKRPKLHTCAAKTTTIDDSDSRATRVTGEKTKT